MKSPKPIDRTCRAPQAQRRNSDALMVRTVAKAHAVEIWLYRGERPIRRQASLSKALVADAERYGQHLLENARNDARRRIERNVLLRAMPG